MRMPSCAPRPVPTSSAVGVASPRAHGQAMISTATAAVKAGLRAARRMRSQTAQRGEREHEHHRDEHRGDAVGEPLHGRLAGLRGRDEPADLREPRLLADAGRAHDERARRVDRRAGHLVAGADVDRHGLAGQQRRVERGRAADHDAVGGDLLAGPDDELVAHVQLRDRHPALDAVSTTSATSLAPRSSSARSASPARRRERCSAYRPASRNVVTTAATSK